MHWACVFGNDNSVNFILSFKNLIINKVDYEGNSSLHMAVTNGSFHCVKKLLIFGIDRSIVN